MPTQFVLIQDALVTAMQIVNRRMGLEAEPAEMDISNMHQANLVLRAIGGNSQRVSGTVWHPSLGFRGDGELGNVRPLKRKVDTDRQVLEAGASLNSLLLRVPFEESLRDMRDVNVFGFANNDEVVSVTLGDVSSNRGQPAASNDTSGSELVDESLGLQVLRSVGAIALTRGLVGRTPGARWHMKEGEHKVDIVRTDRSLALESGAQILKGLHPDNGYKEVYPGSSKFYYEVLVGGAQLFGIDWGVEKEEFLPSLHESGMRKAKVEDIRDETAGPVTPEELYLHRFNQSDQFVQLEYAARRKPALYYKVWLKRE